jgi:signal transduction histidine kinase
VDKNIAENLIVKSDNTKIHQVFMNILANANKFTENGNIAVHTFVENMDNKTVILKTEIIDNGTGISEKDLKKIFEPYYQGVLSDEMDNLGAGLGLSLCKEIVGLFHGDIFVSNNENKGTKVSFSLQLEKII